MKLQKHQQDYVDYAKSQGRPYHTLILFHVFDGEKKVKLMSGLRKGESAYKWEERNQGIIDKIIKLA